MNTMIACALVFTDHDYVLQDYIIPYYSHCLVAFSKTMFGQIVLSNYNIFIQQIKTASQTYCLGSDSACYHMQKKFAEEFDKLCGFYVGEFFCLDENFELEWLAFKDFTNPTYLKCMRLCSSTKVKQKIESCSERVLQTFLNNNS